MDKIKINIWNREFEVLVDYQFAESTEDITSIQKEAFEKIMENFDVVNNSLNDVIKYIKDNNNLNEEITNIFKFVIPTEIFVLSSEKGTREIALLCDYKFDIESGLAIVFENEMLKEICLQDYVL